MAERAVHRSGRSDCVRMFRQYALAWFVKEEQEACDVKLGTRDVH